MIIYKIEDELRAVIALRKGDEVIDFFLESYLQGVEYEKWKEDKDIEVDIYEPVDVSEQMINWKLNNYQLLREFEYLPISEQLDMQFKDKANGTNFWEEHIECVKNKWKKRGQI